MKNITLDDCRELKKKFDRYCNTAEQYQYPLLLMVDVNVMHTIEQYEQAGKIDNQKEANTMFRCVLKVMGEDYSEYE